MGKAPSFGDRALRLSGGFRWAEPHCGFVATSCWIWREGSRHTPNPSSTLHEPPPSLFFSSSLEKCISVKDIQAGSSLHVFCLQPCSSSFTLSCSQLLPHSPARDLKETLGGSWSRGGTHTYADVYMWQAPAKQWLSAEGQRRSGRRRRRGSGKFLGWPDWSINSSPGSAEVRERERERGGESKGKCADLPGESKKVWDCDGVGGGVLLSLCHSGCVQRLWGFSLSLSVRTYCIAELQKKKGE